jgi:hypothetical protein
VSDGAPELIGPDGSFAALNIRSGASSLPHCLGSKAPELAVAPARGPPRYTALRSPAALDRARRFDTAARGTLTLQRAAL